ncbi:MAG TPA: BatA domain-containing protein [Planctomycetia bacterium]|nr:BatA domain-containing protein [Planctomycetia bacterium]
MTIVPMAALPFTFGASGMLAGLAFASLPIIIHLLHRRRFREIEWAAMEWLLEAIRKRARRLRLEQWLLLAVRTMLIALVVLAMAKMTLGAGAGALNLLASAKPVTHMVLVFDNSLSMHYAPGAASRWERAKKIAHQALEDAGAGDLASAVLLGPQPAALVKEASPNLVEVGKEIDGIRPQHGEGKLEPAIEIISSMLKSSRAARKRVVLITDMQRTTFASADGRSEGSELGKKLVALNSLARDFTIVDVGEPKSVNSAVVHLEQVDPLAIVGQPTRFRATLAHFGDAARTSAPVAITATLPRPERPTTIAGSLVP